MFPGKTDSFRQDNGNNPVFTKKKCIYREICGNNFIIYYCHWLVPVHVSRMQLI